MKRYVTVRVVNSSGNPSSGERVGIFVSQFLASGGFPDQYTDSSGEAHFDLDIDASAEITVYVNGNERVPRGSVQALYRVVI